MKLETPIPILRIFDEAKAKEFYFDFLGFRLDWEHRFEEGLPLYMQRSRKIAAFCICPGIMATAVPARPCESKRPGWKPFSENLRRSSIDTPGRPSKRHHGAVTTCR